jgi:hypothetical protein
MVKIRRQAIGLTGLVLAGLLFGVGCAQYPQDTVPASGAAPSYAQSQMTASESPVPAEESKQTAANTPAGAQTPPSPIQLASFEQAQPDRYLIRNASLTLEVKDARKTAADLTKAVQTARGYLSDMQESVDALGVRSITVQVRIPAKRFDGAMNNIEALGKVMDRHVGTEDVTEEFVDSQSHLRNLKRTEERLLTHLARTGKLSDTLLVERELTRVRQEVEQLEGRIRYLANRLAYSTIGVTLQEAPKATSPVPTKSFSSGQIASEASRSLVGFLQSIWSLAIWLAVWSPVWIPLGFLTWFGFRALRRPESSPVPTS